MAENKYNFQKLTPINNSDIKVYEDAIDFVFDNNDIKNVAITGAYSSGKSSVLESYKLRHKDKSFLHISLAHFNAQDQDTLFNIEDIKASTLEGKILNQLIHQIPSTKIPQTNFKIKRDISNRNIMFTTLFLAILFGSLLFLFLSNRISSYIITLEDSPLKKLIYSLSSKYAVLVPIIICIIYITYAIYYIIKVQANKSIFRKLNVNGNEIELFSSQDDSFFDKYLNEVVYLFNNAEADVIVFEDIDRFNNYSIFERLREINLLVNAQNETKSKSKSKTLRFFYLLRDDIFISKDRTKFFDYIIPIIPIIDSSNSYEQFIKLLKESKIFSKFDLSFLQGLSLYVDDMRILKNIYNEFMVYYNKLNTIELDCNKMLAIITYKNLFPSDFNDLQFSHGFVYEVLHEKKVEIIDNCLRDLKTKRDELTEHIKSAKKEILDNIQELEDVYKAKKSRLPKHSYGTYTEDSKKAIKIYDAELEKRKQYIEDKHSNIMCKLESDLRQINYDIETIKTKPINELLNRENIDNVFSAIHKNEIGDENHFIEIKSNEYFELLKYLIRNGHIDETYADYITYFYDGSMSINDKTFLRRITDKRGADYTYKLNNTKLVIDSPVIRQVEFEQEETLNFDILEFLLKNNEEDKYKLYLETLIKQMKTSNSLEFFSEYYNLGKDYRHLIALINKLWPQCFSEAINNQLLSSEQIRRFSIDTLYYSDAESIKEVNANNCLTNYISNSQDYLEINNPDVKKLVAGFALIGIKFERIDYNVSDKALFGEVYHNNLYRLNFSNIALMLNIMYGVSSIDKIAHKNFTTIHSQNDSPLSVYVDANIDEYMEIIIENCNESISDAEDDAIFLLNRPDINIDNKYQYIGYMINKIHDITSIDAELWEELIIHRNALFTASNMCHYFVKYGMNGTLIDYINESTEDLDFTNLVSQFEEDVIKEFSDSVATCNEITTNKYERILTALEYSFDIYNADSIADDKFHTLINRQILHMSADGLKYVRNKYPTHIHSYIKNNFDKYIELQTSDIFSFDEVLEILKWSVDDNKKIELLSFTSKPISIVNKNYSDSICAYIIKNNLDVNDKKDLYSSYANFGDKTKLSIVNIALNDINNIIRNNILIDDELLFIMLKSEKITLDNKIHILDMSLPYINEATCKKCFVNLEVPELNNIFTSSVNRRKFRKSDTVTKVLQVLKKHEWIEDYKVYDSDTQSYKITRRNFQKQKSVK